MYGVRTLHVRQCVARTNGPKNAHYMSKISTVKLLSLGKIPFCNFGTFRFYKLQNYKEQLQSVSTYIRTWNVHTVCSYYVPYITVLKRVSTYPI